MGLITTGKGDGGMTRTYSGESVPKHHLVTETVGNLDEANSLLGLARASVKDGKTKKIILQVQKHLLLISAEVSCLKKHRVPKGGIAEREVHWLEGLIGDIEESLSLPPGFVVFGQHRASSQIDVARTGIRKAERSVSEMSGNKMVENNNILRYLNRLSDLMFLLSCRLEKESSVKKRFLAGLVKPVTSNIWKLPALLGATAIVVLITVALTVFFHDVQNTGFQSNLSENRKGMENVVC